MMKFRATIMETITKYSEENGNWSKKLCCGLYKPRSSHLPKLKVCSSKGYFQAGGAIEACDAIDYVCPGGGFFL